MDRDVLDRDVAIEQSRLLQNRLQGKMQSLSTGDVRVKGERPAQQVCFDIRYQNYILELFASWKEMDYL